MCESLHLSAKRKAKTAFFRLEQNKIVEVKTAKGGSITGIYVVRPHETRYDSKTDLFKVTKWRRTRKLLKLHRINPPIRRVKREGVWKWECTDQNGKPNFNRVRLARRQNGSGGKEWRHGGATLSWFLNNPQIMEHITFPHLEIE